MKVLSQYTPYLFYVFIYILERERRHFPWVNNKRSPPVSQESAQGRRYIPHGYGDDFNFKPHPSFQEPEYTE